VPQTSPITESPAAVTLLRDPATIRARCQAVLAAGVDDALPSFRVDLSALPELADFVAETIRQNYPDLQIPFHSRWRHFTVGGVDRWGQLAQGMSADAAERCRIRLELAITSVLLDAGAGPDWRYVEPGVGTFNRSEGLAVASWHMFLAGGFSADATQPLRADAEGLARVTPGSVASAFQVSAENPLVGLDGRAGVMQRLGAALRAAPQIFGAQNPRIGNLYDWAIANADDGILPARALFGAVLQGLAPIWPGRLAVDGVNMGDVWQHAHASGSGASAGLVPFHKLSQWLTYSLVEPLEEDAGLRITNLDDLTGLPEYRNGGLFIDGGVIIPRTPEVWGDTHTVDSETIVSWRALTVALLDRIAILVRDRLNLAAEDFPLVRILEGGTWAAGRRIAKLKRPDGGPPLRFVSDGTVF
jgi:hypothetical protein